MDTQTVHEDDVNQVLAASELPDAAIDLIKSLATAQDDLFAELQEVREQRDELEGEANRQTGEAFDVLRAVRDWLDNVLLHKRPVSDPRAILRKVERALS